MCRIFQIQTHDTTYYHSLFCIYNQVYSHELISIIPMVLNTICSYTDESKFYTTSPYHSNDTHTHIHAHIHRNVYHSFNIYIEILNKHHKPHIPHAKLMVSPLIPAVHPHCSLYQQMTSLFP